MWLIPLLHGYVSTHLFRCHALYVNCPPTLGLQVYLFAMSVCLDIYFTFFTMGRCHLHMLFLISLACHWLFYSTPSPSVDFFVISYAFHWLFYSVSSILPRVFKTIYQHYVVSISVTSTAFRTSGFSDFSYCYCFRSLRSAEDTNKLKPRYCSTSFAFVIFDIQG